MNVVTRPTEVKCPADESMLVHRKHGKLTVMACPQCHGLWFTGSMLERMREQSHIAALERGVGKAGGDQRVGRRSCPACEEGALSIVRVREIEVDRCTGCGGLWFDAGEIEIIQKRSKTAPNRRRPSSRRERVSGIVADGVDYAMLDFDMLGDFAELVGNAGIAAAEVGVGVAKGLLEVALSAADGV